MTIFFTSDTHFGHANIIEYCDRPFGSVAEMDEEMIQRWNERVRPGDTVWHLGDFSFKAEPIDYFRRLNGHKNLVKGNHDRLKQIRKCHWGLLVETRIMIQQSGTEFLMDHYPILEWERKAKGVVHLHGHQHNGVPRPLMNRMIDVGVDAHDFRPWALEELLDLLKKEGPGE